MSTLSAEEEADLKAMEADFAKKGEPLPPSATVRPERFSEFAPGMSDEGELFPVPPPVPAPAEQ